MISETPADSPRFPKQIKLSDRKIIRVSRPFSIAFQKRIIKKLAAAMPHAGLCIDHSPEPPLLSSFVSVDRDLYLPETITVAVGEFAFSADPTAKGRVVVFVCLRAEAGDFLMWLLRRINRSESLAVVPTLQDHRSQWLVVSSREKEVLIMSAGADYIRQVAIAAASGESGQ